MNKLKKQIEQAKETDNIILNDAKSKISIDLQKFKEISEDKSLLQINYKLDKILMHSDKLKKINDDIKKLEETLPAKQSLSI